MKEAAEFAESTQILMNVSEFTDISTATDTLISAVQAFGYTAETSMEVVDLMNIIGNNYAISTSDLATSLTKSSASLVAAGGDLAEAAALTATANAIIQDADSVGTALKTTSLRLRGTSVKVLEEEGLDSDGAIESTSKLRSQVLATSGVDILTDTGAYKSTYQILLEIAEVWDQITDDKARAGLLELLAGKRNSSVIAALLQNPEDLKAAYEDAMNAEGSALKENERYLDSIQGKIDQFNNAMQSMWSNALDSDVVKGFVEFGTGLVKIIDNVGLLRTAIFGLFTYLSNKKDGSFDLATILGIHNKDTNKWTFGKEGLTGKIKEKLTKKNITKDILGDSSDIEADVKEYAEAITNNINNYVKVDTSEIDKNIEDIQNKLMISRKQLDDAKSKDWAYYKSFGSTAPAKDRDNRIAEKQKEISSLEKDLAKLQTDRSKNMSDAALKYAEISINNTKAETQAQRSLFEALGKVKSVKLSMGNEQDAALKIDQINQAASQGQVALSQYAATLDDNDLALQAYIASLNGGKASLSGFNQFIQQHNAGLKASGIAAKAAAVGHAALNAAISMGISLLIQFAIDGVMKLYQLFKDWINPTQKLTEELNDLKSELRDIQSELKSVNSELETTNDRIAELLAKESLTFVEQEELDKLKETTAELQREKELLEETEKRKKEQVGKGAAKIVESKKGELGQWMNGEYLGQEVNKAIDEYPELQKQIETIQQTAPEYAKFLQKQQEANLYKVEEYLESLAEALDGVEYGDSKESDAALDYYNTLRGRWSVKRGDTNAKSNEIKSILNKKEFADTLDILNPYIEALRNGDKNAEKYIDGIIRTNESLVDDLKARGIEVDDAVDYFTQIGEEANYSTLEGKTKEIAEAHTRLSELFSGAMIKDFVGPLSEEMQNFGYLFDEDGNILSDKIAEFFGGDGGGISEETRAEIERLVKQVRDGKLSVEAALKQFEFFGIESTLEIEISEIQTNFKDVFIELEEADGLIDTFKELGEAIGSTSNALKSFNKAEAEMANSGRVSIETALQLMEYTDDYGSVLQVVDGKLQLVDGAEEALIQTRIDAIRTSAQASLESATNAYQKAQEARKDYENALITDMSAEVVATAWQKTLAAAAGLAAGIKSIWTSESRDDAYNKAYNETLANLTGYEVEYNDDKLQELIAAEAEAKKGVDAAADRVELSNKLTPETLEDINDSDDVDDREDVIKNAWEKLLAKYENKLALIFNERDLIQAEIDKAEAQGSKASSKYYDDLIRSSTEEKNLLIAKQNALEEYLKTNGDYVDQDTWTEMNNEINETAVAIKECTINLLEYYDTLEELDSHYFEQAMDDVSRLGEEIEFVQGLLEDEDVADENGNWTAAGVTRLGLYTNEMERAAASAESYKKQIGDVANSWENYQKLLENATDVNKDGVIDVADISTEELDKLYDTYGYVITSAEEYKEKSDDLTDSMYSEIDAYEAAKDGIIETNEARIDAIKEGIEKEIKAYEDLIDAKKEELDAERDLYKFRRDIQNQTKDISELERRIASLSGSSAASDIAERRRLEAQLMEAKEGLNDTYYDHSRDAQSAALDEEAEAYTLSKERYIEQLEEQLKDTETLIQNSIMDVLFNADTVYNELNTLADTYGVTLSNELTQPWKDASAQAIKWKDELQESMTAGEYAALIGEGGAVTAFANGVATKLKGSWSQAKSEAAKYADYLTGTELKNRLTNTLTGFGDQIQSIIDKWNGVKKAADDAYAAQARKVTVGGTDKDNPGDPGAGDDHEVKKEKKHYVSAVLDVGGTTLSVVKSDFSQGTALNAAKIAILGKYQEYMEKQGRSEQSYENAWQKTYKNRVKYAYQYYAKGTTGTKDDQWAITDEFGPELTMYATPDGTLSFMRAGSTVVPADITANLVEWGKLNPDMLNVNGTPNINMISNAVNKPELNITFDSLIKAENITEETLPAVKKLVTQELNRFTKELNYALKGKGAR